MEQPDIVSPAPPAGSAAASFSPRRLKVLAAEDNPLFQTMLKRQLLSWGYDVQIARDGNEAWEALQAEDPPRLAILDWMMPGMDGVEVCRRLRALNREPYIYTLLLTARTESQDLVEGMEAGADDYVTKPLKVNELRVRLRAGSRIVDLQRQLLEAREDLREQATHDGLTRLLNRVAVLDALETEAARAARDHLPVSVLIVDLDRFKSINDTYGHLAGDEVLRESARRMKAAARRYDAVGRYGGEEFLIVLPGCDAEGGRAHAERIREAVSADPFSLAGQEFRVTCSIGLVAAPAGLPKDTDSLVREADLALYRAKNNGRNRVELAEPCPAAAD